MRAVSILLVLLSHAIGTRGFPVTTTPLLDAGDLGVRIFFVLSGFLITGLLRDEAARHGRIDLRAFYVRRTLRIFPAFYAYLAALALLAAAGVVTVAGDDLLRAATYSINYDADHRWLVGHAWTLAVEEQFYLTWPLVLVAAGVDRGHRAALAAIVLAPVARVALAALPDGTTTLQAFAGTSFETVVDAIATGALLALVRDRLWASPAYRRFIEGRWTLALPVVLLAAQSVPWWGAWVPTRADVALQAVHLGVGITIQNVTIALLLDRLTRFPRTPIGRLLDRPAMVRLGTLSYSLYIWQQLFLDRGTAAWHTRFPQNLLLVLAAAMLSHHAIERPMLRLRDRLLRPRAPDPT